MEPPSSGKQRVPRDDAEVVGFPGPEDAGDDLPEVGGDGFEPPTPAL